MIKNAFYFILKILCVLDIFKFWSWVFGNVEKTASLKSRVSFKTYDVTAWSTNNYNTHIAEYLAKQSQIDNENWPVDRI